MTEWFKPQRTSLPRNSKNWSLLSLLDQSPLFDVAMIDACVGCDDYRKNLATLQWASKQVLRIASQNAKKIIRTG